jgi:tol-pal system protein YbgF
MLISMKTIQRLALVWGLLMVVGCATQADLYQLDDRLTLLEQEQTKARRSKTQLEQQLLDSSQRDQKLREQFASLYASIDRIQEEMQLLTGKIEESAYNARSQIESIDDGRSKVDQKLASINDLLLSLKGRLDRIENFLSLESGTRPKAAKTPKTTNGNLPVSESALYAQAKKAFDQGDNETALAEFQRFIKKYPKSSNADNAQFWIGEIRYRQKWFEEAIQEYEKVIKNYPKGNKVQASMLKQALAFHALGDKANARLILNYLIKQYPNASEAQIAAKKLEHMD